jgi:hypothetical protein
MTHRPYVTVPEFNNEILKAHCNPARAFAARQAPERQVVDSAGGQAEEAARKRESLLAP